MRTHGTLIRWNDERGFGFIDPAGNSGELFVHVSAFPRDGIRPSVGETISFEIEAGSDGRRRAIRIMRPGIKPVQRRESRAQPTIRRSPGMVLGGALLLVALGWYA